MHNAGSMLQLPMPLKTVQEQQFALKTGQEIDSNLELHGAWKLCNPNSKGVEFDLFLYQVGRQ